MKTFLEYVARDILTKYGTDLSNTVVVFPNKRASLFLNDALARQTGHPLWAPAYMTISELFRHHATLQVADPIKLVCDLYRSYTEITGFDETFDHFYGWGQLLITDFDDIDKNMAPADKVFANLRDIREFDDVSYLNEEQKNIIRKFFSNFSEDHNSLLKQRFLRLWSRMGDIYHDFNNRLAAQGLAYEGALYRQVAENPELTFRYERYLFVGFNLLQKVEQELFTRIKDNGKAFFYWDFDHYYMRAEAGHFISQYMEKFPNELDNDCSDIYRNFQRPKTINLIAASTEDIQARYIGQWLSTDDRIAAGRQTAIVLCNEGLLQTVIHNLPPSITHVNITTGYPLQQTAVATRIQQMLSDHTLTEVITHITQMSHEVEPEDPLTAESLFRAYTLLNRLQMLVNSGDLCVTSLTMQRLVTQLIQQTSIPFHGEPAVGLQVMGVLETRNLDFRHILILSANEGNMPRGITDSSFIPYSLRRAFGLTTAEHKAAIYAYYFNRLISRAEDITIVYNNSTVDGKTAEMSRFLLQLIVEDSFHLLNRYTLTAGQHTLIQYPQAIKKTPAVIDSLREHFSKSILSPTAINSYMRCPLQFYYCYVEGLYEPDDTEKGIIDNRVFGNIFHNAAQQLYEKLMQKSPQICATDLECLLKSKVDIERAVDAAFLQEFHGQMPEGGMAVINREVIIHYLRQLVEIDRKLTPFTILQLEKDVLQLLKIPTLGLTVRIGGRVDRLDLINRSDETPQVRVIDYKTSAYRLKPFKTIDDIFDDSQQAHHSDYYLQTLLYARIVSKTSKYPVAPALLFIQHAATDDFNPILKLGNEYINDVATPEGDHFVSLLTQKVREIFDPSLEFTPTADTSRCRNCPYAHLCGIL